MGNVAKGVMHKSDGLAGEVIMATLSHRARCTVDLIEVSEGESRHFILRKVKFFAANNIKGYEIKFSESEGRILADALRLTLGPSLEFSKSEPGIDEKAREV